MASEGVKTTFGVLLHVCSCVHEKQIDQSEFVVKSDGFPYVYGTVQRCGHTYVYTIAWVIPPTHFSEGV